jgi:ATP-dependent Clp protease ATP-binding subunit ClpA
VTEAIALDHNYVGCEHLLLGLVAAGEGTAAAALRDQGADHRSLRRAVVAALAGYVHLRAQGQPPGGQGAAEATVVDVVARQLAPVTERLAALEARFDAR